MATWSNATVTEKGYALQAKLLSTDSLVITRVVSGSGRVTAGQLVKQTAVSEEKQALTVEALSYDNNGNAIIKTSLNNKNLTSGYTCNQIGIYASDPDEGEILYAIAQEATAGEDIPSITEQPNGYYCSWVFSLTFSNSSNVSVTIDPANALTKEAADALYPSRTEHENDLNEISPLLVTCNESSYENGEYCNLGEFDKTMEEVITAFEAGRQVILKLVAPQSYLNDVFLFCAGHRNDSSVFFHGYASETIIISVYWSSTPAIRRILYHYQHNNIKTFGEYKNSLGFNGAYNNIKGDYASAFGYKTTANTYQFLAGKYNREVAGLADTEAQSADSSIFMIGYGTSTTPANAMRVSSAGKCYGASAFLGSGADFPEFEEWADGNPDNEDRRGRFAALEGDKIVLASSEKDHIIGVVSVMGAFIANSASENWKGMYLKDVFGENLTQQVEIPEKTIEKKVFETDEEGNRVEKTITEVIPAHTVTQFVVNPEYNPDEEYIGREFRKEWAPVGKLGQVIVVDDGTCTVGGYCKPSANGIGTAGEYGYYVRKRIDSTHIKVEISPGAFNK